MSEQQSSERAEKPTADVAGGWEIRARDAERKLAEIRGYRPASAADCWEAAFNAVLAIAGAPASDPLWEYAVTSGPRKMWDDYHTPPEGEGWEFDPNRGSPGQKGWERFDYHEERYWRRPYRAAQAGVTDAQP